MPALDVHKSKSSAVSTPDALISAGEKLFAERGIESPSIRELIATAGVGNKSALHYHFGTRAGLVAAILGKHGEALRNRRALAFEPLVIDDASHDLQRLCDVVVRPYCEFLEGGPAELSYLIISAEVLADPTRRYEDLEVLFNDTLLPRIIELMLAELDLPEQLAAERLIVGISQVISAVATRARQQLFSKPVRTQLESDVFVGNVIDMLLGALTAPVGQATLAALET